MEFQRLRDTYGNICIEVIHPTLFDRQEGVIYSPNSHYNPNLKKCES